MASDRWMDFRLPLENNESIYVYLLLTNRDTPRPDCIHEIQNIPLKGILEYQIYLT